MPTKRNILPRARGLCERPAWGNFVGTRYESVCNELQSIERFANQAANDDLIQQLGVLPVYGVLLEKSGIAQRERSLLIHVLRTWISKGIVMRIRCEFASFLRLNGMPIPAKHIAEGSRPLRKTSLEYAMFPCRTHGTMMESRSATFNCLLFRFVLRNLNG
jgi:hypothetical protein